MVTRFTSVSSMQRFILSLLLLSLTILTLDAHYRAPSIGDLTIHAVAEGKVTVTLADRRKARQAGGAPLAECVFTYKTTEKGAQAAVEPPKKEFKTESVPSGTVDVIDVARQLEGSCISSTSDYWTYEYCFGKYFKQYHGGDVYWLARQSSSGALQLQPDGKAFIMAGGDICATLTPPSPRQVRVNWACRKNAHTPQIVSISETSMCVYQIQIASSLICRDPSFPVLADDWVPPPSSNAPGPLDTGSEDWFVELVELESKDEQGEQILMCQAYSLEYRATSLKGLRFAEYELKINRLQGESSSHRSDSTQLPREYQTPIARRASRVPVDSSNLSVSYGRVALSPSAGSNYDGALSFIKVYA